MNTLDEKLLHRLALIGESNEGSIFNPFAPAHYTRMIGLIESVLDVVYATENAPRLVEIGAHRAYFAYVCCEYARSRDLILPTIDEFDIAPWSAIACGVVAHEYPGTLIRFHLVESERTIPAFCPDGRVDLVYVDGGHDYRNAFSDCSCAARWDAAHVIVDDSGEGLDPYRAAVDALGEQYEEVCAARAGNDCTRWYQRLRRA